MKRTEILLNILNLLVEKNINFLYLQPLKLEFVSLVRLHVTSYVTTFYYFPEE